MLLQQGIRLCKGVAKTGTIAASRGTGTGVNTGTRRFSSNFAQTSGDYGNNPKPVDGINFWLQYRGFKEMVAVSVTCVCIVSYNAPVWTAPMWLPMKWKLRDLEEKYGCPRYGAGKTLSTGGF